MARCPAHGNRIQLNPSGAVNLFGATPQPDCRWTDQGETCETLVVAVKLLQQLVGLIEPSHRFFVAT